MQIAKGGPRQRVLVIFMVAFDTVMEKVPIKLKSCWHPINNCIDVQEIGSYLIFATLNAWQIINSSFSATYICHWRALYISFSSNDSHVKEECYHVRFKKYKPVCGHANSGQYSATAGDLHLHLFTVFFLIECVTGYHHYLTPVWFQKLLRLAGNSNSVGFASQKYPD